MKLLITIILVLYFCSLLEAQQRIFQHYTIDNGLSQSVVNSIFLDSDGFLWIGTQDGLNRFDGEQFTRFFHSPTNTNSISNNWIYQIVETERRLYIGTRLGLQEYDKRTGTFRHFFSDSLSDNTFQSDYIYGMNVSINGAIWVNTPSVLSLFDPVTKKVSNYFHGFDFSGGIEDQVRPVYEDTEGIVWLGTSDGLLCFNPENETFRQFEFDSTSTNSVPDNSIWDIAEDLSGSIWIGTENGLSRYNKQKNEFRNYYHNSIDNNSLSSNFIRTLLITKENSLWVGTDGGGLNEIIIDSASNELYFNRFKSSPTNAAALKHDIVLSLCKDNTNMLWVGTLQGLDKTSIRKPKFELYRRTGGYGSINLLDNVIAALYSDEKNRLWIGNWGKGLNILDRQTGKVEHFTAHSDRKHWIPDNYAHIIFEDSKQNIWLGTRNGVAIWDRKELRFVSLSDFFGTDKLPDFTHLRIYSILEHSSGEIWIGTRSGLYQIDMSNYSYNVYKSGLGDSNISSDLIYDLEEDPFGKIWIGTTNGLDIFDYKTHKIRHIKRDPSKKNTLISNFIVSLCCDSEGDMWLGTKSGINRFDVSDSVFHFYSESQGVPSIIIYGIEEDDNNNVWFSSGRGLFVYRRDKTEFRIFGVEDGLQSLEFNLRATYKAENGEMFFGGMNGVNAFHPDSMNFNKLIPPIVLTSLNTTNAEGNRLVNISDQKKIVFDYTTVSFTIEFAALDFTNSEKNNYSYKLEGGANQWIELNDRNFVPFTNLPSGNYVFHVKGCNNDGFWNNEGTSIQIVIKPPWWRSIVAYFIYFILGITLILAFIKLRERRLVYERKLLARKVAERTMQIEKQKQHIEVAYKNVEMLSLIGQEVTAQLAINIIVRTVYKNVTKLMDTSIFGIGLVEKVANKLVFSDSFFMDNYIPKFSYHLENDYCPATICFNENREIHTNTFAELPEYKQTKSYLLSVKNKTIEPNSVIYLPLLASDSPIGVISVQSTQIRAYSQNQLDILRNVAVYTSIAVQNAESFRKIKLQKEEIENQRNEIEIQRDLATTQRDQIGRQKKEMIDSIQYAKRIQDALLPANDMLEAILSDYFILFKPRNIVSGDFFWIYKDENKIIIAAADCTGHGVPGAFMSMLGISFLNEIAKQGMADTAGEILGELRNKVKTSLKQTGTRAEPKDGMDIALCIIEPEKHQLQYAGAHNPLYIIREDKLLEIKATRNPIGIYRRERDFENHVVDILADDRIYICSDGYADQIGGPRNRKFMVRNFKTMLLDIHHKEMSEQEKYLKDTLLQWQGQQSQVDDILIIGMTGKIVHKY